MNTVPGFWDVGPHDPIDVEATWREFVRSVDGDVIEDLLPQPRPFENADFLFRAVPAVAELKEVKTEFEKSDAFEAGYLQLFERLMSEVPHWRPPLPGENGDYPEWFPREVIRLFRPPIQRILKKANSQIKETKKHFKIGDPTGILVFVNDGFTALEPHFVQAIAEDLLVHSYSSIDCFLYITVNRYVEVDGSDVPRLLWIPKYSGRVPVTLSAFINDLGRSWYAFLETKIGPFTVPTEEIKAGPITSRAIVLPGERE
ncbi:hypothetical protein FX985_01356 [Pseudomonas extremaustralis]|uniref:Uncharacterized protein n=1 Tax=Pseudomonas extremaustralis TaxID=359110 RepID=A0A5M9IWZ1_9PSED|nr:hypothetical protein [Pseudomonas extremaustralis]KAA8561304.1 hypothetical protein FX985_01356 [Pseudomonas extremaustralis]